MEMQRKTHHVSDGHDYDRFSVLPDEILVHILSLLNNTHEAIATSILSRRWRNLWKYTLALTFRSYPPPQMIRSDFPTFVDKSLDLHEAIGIEKLEVSLDYINNDDAHRVDKWIHYAVTHNVRRLFMDFASFDFEPIMLDDDDDDSDVLNNKPYVFPPCFFSSFASLEVLSVSSCRLEIPPFSRFTSLRKVDLLDVTLAEDAVKDITSASPCLETLMICQCMWVGTLKIYIENPKVRGVMIFTSYAQDIAIDAPKLQCLGLQGQIVTGKFHIKDLSSIKILGLQFEGMFDVGDGEFSEHHGDSLIKLLDSLGRVRSLNLCSWCLQVLAVGVIKGAQCLRNPQLSVVVLELRASLEKWELPGIEYLFKSCPKLGYLVIQIASHKRLKLNSNFMGEHDFNGREHWKLQEVNSSSFFDHLKIIKITGLMSKVCLRAKENTNNMTELVSDFVYNMAEVLSDFIYNEMWFIGLLLRRSVAMEKMIISTTKDKYNDQLLSKVVQELLVLPKASQKAEIVIGSN